jgi:DNA processing protein
MKRFLVNDPSAMRLIAASVGDATEVELAEHFARASFSLITEPGDRFAGELIRALSPETVLELLIARTSSADFASRLSSVDCLDDIENRHGRFEELFTEALQRWLPRLKLTDVISAFEDAARVKARLLIPRNALWPEQLNDLAGAAPHCLWYRSNLAEPPTDFAAISIVGSRNSTSYGDWVTSEIVSDCATRGLAVVSGGAYGIDAIAHRSALANDQETIAFLAGGIDRLYPSGNSALFEKVIDRGVIFAEQAPGASPTKWRFLQRNRLIAAMSPATIVIEAGQRSGALNTVSHAIELGRSVGAVPGPITSQSSAGCNRLVSEGLVSSVCTPSDAADLALGKAGWFQPELGGLGAYETRALDAMGSRPLSEDLLASRAGLTSKEASIALGQLSLLGFVKQTDRGWLKLPLESEQRSETGGY